MNKMNIDNSLKNEITKEKIKKKIISNLISHTSPKLKLDAEIYSINIGHDVFTYSIASTYDPIESIKPFSFACKPVNTFP